MKRFQKRSTVRRTKIRGGAIFTTNSDQLAVFLNFIKKSKVELLTPINSSSYGVLLKLTLESDIPEPEMNYWRIDTRSILNSTGLEKVKSLCVKLGFINDYPISFKFIDSLNKSDSLYEIYIKKRTVTKLSTIAEIETQIDIVRATYEDFEPVTPNIVFSGIFLINDYKVLDTLISKAVPKLKTILISIKNALKLYNAELSIIAMEILDDSKTLLSYLRAKYTDLTMKISCMVLYEIIRTALKSKIINLDLHRGNILIVPNYPYFESINYRAFLIDFGLNKRLTEDEYQRLTEYSGQLNYAFIIIEILRLIRNDDNYKNTSNTIKRCFFHILMHNQTDGINEQQLNEFGDEIFNEAIKLINKSPQFTDKSLQFIDKLNYSLLFIFNEREMYLKELKKNNNVELLRESLRKILIDKNTEGLTVQEVVQEISTGTSLLSKLSEKIRHVISFFKPKRYGFVIKKEVGGSNNKTLKKKLL